MRKETAKKEQLKQKRKRAGIKFIKSHNAEGKRVVLVVAVADNSPCSHNKRPTFGDTFLTH